LIGRRSAVGSLIVAGLLLVTVVLALAFWAWKPFGTTVLTTETISQPLQGAGAANVKLNFDVGTLRVSGLTGSNNLITGSVMRTNNETLDQDFYVRDGTAYYTIKSTNSWVLPFFDNGQERHEWDLQINATVPTNLTVATGVGNSNLDLEKLNLTAMAINMGTGDTAVLLPARGTFDAELNAGVGNLTVSIPEGMAARIHLSAGLGKTDVAAAYPGEDKLYESPDYGQAANRVELNINAGVGNITIRQVKPSAPLR
jgi:hypothetical protein